MNLPRKKSNSKKRSAHQLQRLFPLSIGLIHSCICSLSERASRANEIRHGGANGNERGLRGPGRSHNLEVTCRVHVYIIGNTFTGRNLRRK